MQYDLNAIRLIKQVLTQSGYTYSPDISGDMSQKYLFCCQHCKAIKECTVQQLIRHVICRCKFGEMQRVFSSITEIKVFNIIKNVFVDAELHAKVSWFEIDILIPSIKTTIEIDYYIGHFDRKRDKTKFATLKNLGYTPLMVRHKLIPSINANYEVLGKTPITFGDITNILRLIRRHITDNEYKRLIARYIFLLYH